MLAAGRKSTPQADVALEDLCRTYWYPLYAFVRRQGHSKEDAEDLTQAFFARFLEKNYLEGLNAERGRFRAFLLASLKHFLANERDRADRVKRGGGVTVLTLDWQDAETRYHLDPADTLSPDKLFDRAWAVTLLERVIVRLREENGAGDKAKLFDKLKPFLSDLNDVKKLLDSELSRESVKSAANLIKQANWHGEDVVESLKDVETELDRVSAELAKYK